MNKVELFGDQLVDELLPVLSLFALDVRDAAVTVSPTFELHEIGGGGGVRGTATALVHLLDIVGGKPSRFASFLTRPLPPTTIFSLGDCDQVPLLERQLKRERNIAVFGRGCNT